MKSHLETQIYRTNNAFKAELRKMINYKDEQPGPGAYEVNKNLIDSTPAMFQFFGSTVQRFPDTKTDLSLGPGAYKVNEGSPEKKEKHSFENL